VPYITGTVGRNLTQIIKTVSTLGSSRDSSDKLNDLSTKLYKAPEHLVLENPMATIQTAMVPSIQNTRAHHVTLDTKNETWYSDTSVMNTSLEWYENTNVRTHTRTHTKMHDLLAAGNFHKDEHGNTTHPTHVESTSCTKGKPTNNIKWQIAI
jgi:hypothetical protein